MRVVVLWREERDYSRQVIDWLHDFEHQTGRTIESVDPDTRDGIELAKAYDILEFPAFLALNDDGSVAQVWKGAGMNMPRVDDINYYLTT